MTAEIAILNKSAIALAADSAVTISAGSDQEKIYDSADKLFELSTKNPIGVMIYNDMNFVQIPLPVIIKEYRLIASDEEKIEDSARHFIQHLRNIGASSPEATLTHELDTNIWRILNPIKNRIEKDIMDAVLSEQNTGDMSFEDFKNDIVEKQVQLRLRLVKRLPDAEFEGGDYYLNEISIQRISELVSSLDRYFNQKQQELVTETILIGLKKIVPNSNYTGVIVAGYGSKEIFPTLVSYKVYGMVGSLLKYQKEQVVDIDRNGERARVIPFAQKEMVERFMYGIDNDIERAISLFCKQTVPNIRQAIMDILEADESDLVSIEQKIKKAERSFFDGLQEGAFEQIRQDSRNEIESMVEFMPKHELARMAEALVNLTSIKRRVSRGMETVGGPIDVAVISKSEGFVWISRKHYFKPELNQRYFERVRCQLVGEGS